MPERICQYSESSELPEPELPEPELPESEVELALGGVVAGGAVEVLVAPAHKHAVHMMRDSNVIEDRPSEHEGWQADMTD